MHTYIHTYTGNCICMAATFLKMLPYVNFRKINVILIFRIGKTMVIGLVTSWTLAKSTAFLCCYFNMEVNVIMHR